MSMITAGDLDAAAQLLRDEGLEEDARMIEEICPWCGADTSKNWRNRLVSVLCEGRICRECDEKIKRTRPRPYPVNSSLRKYVERVEKGEEECPYDAYLVICEGDYKGVHNDPILLTPAGNFKKVRVS